MLLKLSFSSSSVIPGASKATRSGAAHPPGCPCCSGVTRSVAHPPGCPCCSGASKRSVLVRAQASPPSSQLQKPNPPKPSSNNNGNGRGKPAQKNYQRRNGSSTDVAALEARVQQLTEAMEKMGQSITSPAPASAQPAPGVLSINQRTKEVKKHFPSALAVDDFMNRVEVALASKGFTGNNTIAMSNLCRDESCMILEDKIESVFGSCFSTHGLGGVLTCGVIGIKAGLSHSPVLGGKEQYVFFSFPHIAIDSDGGVGKISRPNRPDTSAACGALCACLGQLQAEGLDPNCKTPGVHDAEDPEYSILKQRLARQLKSENCNVKDLDLVSITKAAERTITNDLKHLISKAVDPSKANYAVFTGVQIHNWATDLTDGKTPSLEFVAPGDCYTVINAKMEKLNVNAFPALSPRQLRLLGHVAEEQHPDNELPDQDSVVQEIPRGYLMRRIGGAAGARQSAMQYVTLPSDE